ncbi:uncharacterized protein DUF2480 [Gelidibacter algens]|jgi:hypothetical protein|uniref:Uncharacterized protein DUF2480 n=1 Tax=Gelidibacter algens TaxID=49280 RepID=A0A1A7QZ45_9FLAO|nr:DUF2480 family protein [Gelidibacter algens]OBX25285.1 hypothetical protein A9996_10620 [Gelidibacter algens]RAJ25815.1 uncharacterized protein DUF2480 [Gelidibacter algens]
MEDEIINRVASSKLVVVDLEDYYPKGNRSVIDIKDWLFQELVLREKDFREYVKQHDWTQYQDHYVALTCTSDAIVPAWAFMLLTMHLQPYAKTIVIGSLEQLETSIYQDVIQNLDTDSFVDQPLIIKGCANKPVPANAYIMLSQKLKPIAKSIMYGEACSSVPLYKRK